MDANAVKEYIGILAGTDVTILEIEREGVKVKITRGKADDAPAVVEITEIGDKPASPLPLTSNLVEVKTQLVGTFYRAASPGEKPYVEVGDMIEKGQVLCVIEAMKLMNQIESEVSGKVVSILVENEHPVEYDEVLFHIEPTDKS